MNANFDTCMTMLLAHEGGYVNDSRDNGGMTNLGVTKAVYDEFYGGDASEEVMKALSKGDVEPIYRRNYWERCRCQDLPSGVDWAVFDLAVNSGTGRAAKLLQRAVEAEEDGSIGPLTLMLVNKNDTENIINRIACIANNSIAHYRISMCLGEGG